MHLTWNPLLAITFISIARLINYQGAWVEYLPYCLHTKSPDQETATSVSYGALISGHPSNTIDCIATETAWHM